MVTVGLVFLGTLFATGFTLLPQVQQQANQFLRNREQYIADADKQVNLFLLEYPSLYDALAKHKEAPNLTAAVNPVQTGNGGETAIPVGETPKDPEKPDTQPTEPGTQPNEPGPGDDPQDSQEIDKERPKLNIVRDLVGGVVKSLAENPLEIGQSVFSYASSFLMSLLFSFLIVLDLKKIKHGVQGLKNTKIGFIYDEVADNIAGFGRVLGRALEAQLFIAVCNTILTAIGIWILGLDNLLVLSTIVFFCSFIPVVGTFISSTPIALLALQSGGVSTMLIAIVMIMVVHALETYVLNPQIYGHHMHMNPVLVLIVLTIGGKLFGIWGLILGIPIVNYVFRHAIRHTDQRPVET